MTVLLGLFKFALTIFAIILIIVGVIITPTPIPFGIIFIALGIVLLILVAPAFIRGMRRRFGWFERFMHWAEKRLPGWMARRFRDSDIEHDEQKEENAEDEEEARAKAISRLLRQRRPFPPGSVPPRPSRG